MCSCHGIWRDILWTIKTDFRCSRFFISFLFFIFWQFANNSKKRETGRTGAFCTYKLFPLQLLFAEKLTKHEPQTIFNRFMFSNSTRQSVWPSTSKVRVSVKHMRRPQSAMTNFLAAAPHSVNNGAVKMWSYQKKQETELASQSDSDSGYSTQQLVSGHRPRLIAVQLLHPVTHLAPKRGNNDNNKNDDDVSTDLTSFDFHSFTGNMFVFFLFSYRYRPTMTHQRSYSLWRSEKYFYVHYNPGHIHGK